MVPSGPLWSGELFEWSILVANVTLMIWLLFWLADCVSGDSPRWLLRLLGKFAPVTDRFAFQLPWRRRRMQRDFSVMLALLLDVEVPEDKAVRLAAESTANRVFLMRAERVVADLRQGVKLTEAVRWLDDAGEFRWRLRNAAQAGRGFVAALDGWHETLEAKAFQQEQIASQTITTGFVFLNGLMVSLIAVALFQLLIAVIEVAAW